MSGPAVIRRLALAATAAWLVLAAVILGGFSEEALPVWYLGRPLLVAAAVALLIGAVSLIAGRYAVAVAAGAAMLLALAHPAIVLSLLAVLLLVELLRRRGRMSGGGQRPVLIVAGLFFVIGSVRALTVMDLPTDAGYEADAGGPPMYVILLDGYPRIDTLAGLSIDNRPFVDALEDRGFDHYPDAYSVHTRTHKTLLAMLTNETVNNDPVTVDERRAIRRRLTVPPGFIAVDPSLGFVTLGIGPHLSYGGSNDFEAQLLAESAVGVLIPDVAWGFLIGDLRNSIEDSLTLVTTREERRIFAHLVVPHPPFLYAADGSADPPRWCWPVCGFYTNNIDDLGVTRRQWADGMAAQLDALNPRILTTVDRVLDRHPDAVIVLFSDHGGRIDRADRDEWHRSFLAARTPGHPRLFAGNPRPDTIIRTLLSAYP